MTRNSNKTTSGRRKLPWMWRLGFGMVLYGLLVNVYFHQVLDLSFASSSHRGLRSEEALDGVTTSQHLRLPSKPIGSLRQIFQELQIHGESFAPSLQYLLDKALDAHDSTPKSYNIPADSSDHETLCQRYHFKYNHKKRQPPRGVFWGSLIADDSWHTLLLQATESFDLFHSVAFVESNTTQTLTKRALRFYVDEKNGDGNDRNVAMLTRLRSQALSKLWGTNTKVTVDLYVHDQMLAGTSDNTPTADANKDTKNGLWLQNENLQRDLIIQRWKANGMTEQDIGIISDVDEVISRDFVRALQVCDGIKPFTRHNHCKAPKLTAPSLVVEGSPRCVVTQRKWQHPDVILGECIDEIANNEYFMHPVPERAPRYGAMMRLPGWEKMYEDMYYPLWTATDFRMEDATSFWPAKDTFPVAWHFHNFFDSIDSVRNKYLTYGHPVEEAATIPLENISRDLDFMVGCLTGRSDRGSALNREASVPWAVNDADTKDNAEAKAASAIPRAFQLAPEYPRMRHEELRQLVLADERSRQEAGAISVLNAR